MIRLFCATIFVFTADGEKTLLVNHKKLQKWVPAGGKIDPNELPDDAAIRECLEETGVKITLLGERAPVLGGLIRPRGMQLNTVIPHEKEHIDFIYIAVANEEEAVVLNEQETSGVQWFDIATIIHPEFNTFDSVKQWVEIMSDEMKRKIYTS